MAGFVLVDGLVFHRSLPAGWVGLLVTAFFGTVLYRVFCGKLKARVLYSLTPALLLTLYVGFWFRFRMYPPHRLGGYTLQLSSVCYSWALAYLVFALFFLMRDRTFPRWTLWLGRISYSLYLMHWLPILLIPGSWNPILYLTLCLAFAVGIAHLTYNFVEKPAIAIGRTRFLPLFGGKKVAIP
jgi:peptidoglycan/LPS O-acetylase OafA/YrhL